MPSIARKRACHRCCAGADVPSYHRVLAHALGWRRDRLAALTRNAVEACWLDGTDKAALLARVEAMVATTPDAPPAPEESPA